MNKQFSQRIALGIALALLAGCRSAPVYNVEEAQIVVPSSARLGDIEQAIVRGAKRAGWQAKPVRQGRVMATYSAKRGRLQAVVDIDFDMDSYDIHYRSSQNLKFRETAAQAEGQGQDDNFINEYNPFTNPEMNPFSEEEAEAIPADQPRATIHKAYNQWVRQLEEQINLELAKLPMHSNRQSAPRAAATSPTFRKSAPVAVDCADSPERSLSGRITATRSQVNLRSGVGTRCSIVGSLGKGDTVSLTGSKGKWYSIATADGRSAWVYAPLVRRVDEAAAKAAAPAPASTLPPPAAAPGEKISIAVIRFKTLNKEAQDIALGDLVSETFTSALVNSSQFKITEREQLDKVIREMEMSQTGLIDTTDAVQIGKMLQADAIITGSVALLGEQIQLNARVIDIESAYVVSAETKTSRYTLSNINTMVNEIVARLASRFHRD